MGSEPAKREGFEQHMKNVQSFFRAPKFGKPKSAPSDSNGETSGCPSPHTSHGRLTPPACAFAYEDASNASDGSRPESLNGSLADLEARAKGEETSTSGNDSPHQPRPMNSSTMPEHRLKKFHKLLGEPMIDVDALRELAWNGIPEDLRPMCWKLMLGYLPPAKARQAQTLARRRQEYRSMVPEYYDIANSERSEEEVGALRQVAVDVPRTIPTVPFFHQDLIQKSLERMLYIWGIRHPASGYVQGMNDLVTPFITVFLSEFMEGPMSSWCVDTLPESLVLDVEADCYWCLCKLLEGIQDNYTSSQPGIQRTIFRLKELIRRIDDRVADHMDRESVDFLQFSFRWVNCLLIREVPFPLAVRLWDTYIAEGAKFNDFLVYVCASFLLTWSDKLQRMEFQDIILFLQHLPTQEWDEKQMELVLSKAYIWRASFGQAQSHLKS